MRYDSVVVGASVVGGVCAKELCLRGLKTAMLSDKAHVGKGGKCTSIISKKGLDRTGIRYQDAVLHPIHGARIFSRHARMTVRTPHVQALVLDRFKLDELSVGQAQDAGSELFTSSRFSAFDGKAAMAGKDFPTSLLVGADGVASTVAKTQGFPPLSHLVVAWEGEFENAFLDDPSLVDVFLDFPGLFAWSVPCGDDVVRIGLAVKTGAVLEQHKKRLLGMPSIRKNLRGSTQSREFYHAIPLRYRRITQKENVLLVGDAAGQVKATTGGGIVFGSLCAKEAAEAGRDFLDGKALTYESAWRKKYARPLDAHRYVRGFLDRAPFSLTSLGVSVLSSLGFSRVLERFGDMDFIVRGNDSTPSMV